MRETRACGQTRPGSEAGFTQPKFTHVGVDSLLDGDGGIIAAVRRREVGAEFEESGGSIGAHVLQRKGSLMSSTGGV